jgi:DNA/RNA-binding domain of Phe-tRNA-synthetase-like protein
MIEPLSLTIASHPLLDPVAFVTDWQQELSCITFDASLHSYLRVGVREVPMRSDDEVRSAVRTLLRHGGYKPTGRGKPASEYLLRAAEDGSLSTINIAVDLCNIVSLHSGLPISVIDLDRAIAPLSIRLGTESEEYVFNASGQVISIGGLLCLCDSTGPCANGVKDSQRTKTHGATRRTLSVIWGTRSLAGRSAQAAEWYRSLTAEHGGQTQLARLVDIL